MPFAVSCRSCGARFSVADDLYQKRFAGRIVTVRCKHCQASIRLDASEPPARPPKPKLDRRPKWVPKPAPPPPRPPHVRAAALAAAKVDAAKVDAAKVDPAKIDPAKIPRAKAAPEEIDPEDLFKTPPPSAPPPGTADEPEPPIDLTEYAHSEPPSSKTPALFELAHDASRQRAPEVHEDVEFLLGLSGSPRTAAALVSPALPTFEATDAAGPAEEDEATRAYARPPSKHRDAENLLDAEPDGAPANNAPAKELALALPVPSAPVAPTPLAGSASTATPSDTPPPKRRWPAALVVLGLGAIGGALGLFAHGSRIPEASVGSSASSTHPAQPEPAAIQPDTNTATAASAVEGTNAPSSNEPSSNEPSTAKSGSAPAPTAAEPKPSVAAAPAPAPVTAPAPKPASAPNLTDTRSPPPAALRAEKPASPVEKPEALAPTPRPEAASAPPSAPQYEVSDRVATEPFDRSAAAAALSRAAEEASACRKEGDPTGTASATVTFAPSGRVTTATLSGPPFAGTKTGSCIAASLRRARVPAFMGDKVTVGKTVVIR